MKKSAYRLLLKRVKDIEENWGDLQEFVLFSTFGAKAHTMKIGENAFSYESLEKVYAELSDLQMCDLLDFQNMSEENGKFG